MDLSKFIFQQIMVICNRHNEKFLQCCNDERGSDDSKDKSSKKFESQRLLQKLHNKSFFLVYALLCGSKGTILLIFLPFPNFDAGFEMLSEFASTLSLILVAFTYGAIIAMDPCPSHQHAGLNHIDFSTMVHLKDQK